MDDKTSMGPVPPYQQHPGGAPSPMHTGSYPSQPNDGYNVSPPPQHQPYGVPPQQPYGAEHQQPIQHIQPIQPIQPVQHTGTGIVNPDEKREYYAQGEQQPQVQHQGTFQAGQQQPHQFQTAVPLSGLNRSPAPVDCPCCHARALTTVNRRIGNTTHVWGFICCLTTLLCCIPYVISATKDVEHKCSRCGVLLAVWHRGSSNTEVLQHA